MEDRLVESPAAGYRFLVSKSRPPKPELPEPRVPPKDPARLSSHRPLRPRDSMGALRPNQAELDAAHAAGYAAGLSEARDEAMDDLRTLLTTVLEYRFGELEERALDCVGEADMETLKKWITAAMTVTTLDELFGA